MILLASSYSHNYGGILASPLEIYCQCSIKVVHDKLVKQASKDLLQHNITRFHWLLQLQQAACLWILSNKSILPHWWGFHTRQPYSINGHIMLLYAEDLALRGALHIVCHKRIQTSSCFSSSYFVTRSPRSVTMCLRNQRSSLVLFKSILHHAHMHLPFSNLL